MLENVHWLGHASIKITGEKTVYVDPYQIEGGETADLILITHDHYDHLSQEDLKKIQGEKTVIVTTASSAEKVRGNVKTVSPGDTLTVEGVEIHALPAYNIDKQYHPKDRAYVGFLFKVGGKTYYHAGDTDLIPEMKDLKPDVAFLPVGGTFTMNAQEAANAVKEIQPKVVVPMHWGSIVGSVKDAETFKGLCKCDVQILERES